MTASFYDTLRVRAILSQKTADKIELVEVPSKDDRAGYKRYEVMLRKKRIGSVMHADETVDLKRPGDRFVYRRWTRKRWRYDVPAEVAGARLMKGIRSRSLYYETRKRAVYELIEDLLRNGWKP